MKVSTHIVIVLAFGILCESGFRIQDNHQDGGWGLHIQHGEPFLQDYNQIMLEEAMELLHRNRMQQVNPELEKMRGLSITNNLEVLKERLINRIGRKRSQQVQA